MKFKAFVAAGHDEDQRPGVGAVPYQAVPVSARFSTFADAKSAQALCDWVYAQGKAAGAAEIRAKLHDALGIDRDDSK